ncbi:calcium-activated chloride channel regulator 1-like [Haemaphysalis longicornis]
MLPVGAALLCFLGTAATLQIDTTDGGYKDLLVSIGKDVPHDDSIVDNIKALFRSSSEFLHRATNGRVYFKHVTIEVPDTWPKRDSARPLSSSSFELSDVRVEGPTKARGDTPFTEQPRPCGQPGEFIQLTPGFLARVQNTTARKTLLPEYMFVHEWAHYRYGVFDECGSLGDVNYPLTYCDKCKVKLNACSERIVFEHRSKTGDKCHIDEQCRLGKDCVAIFGQPDKNPVESSIMFMPYITNVSQFCDVNQGSRQHNPLAPNKQNALCKGKSTWEVISENADFKKLPSPDASKLLQVTFEEVQQKDDLAQRVVLVLDLSASMAHYDRLVYLKEATTRYLGSIEDSSRRLAIVTFHHNATVAHPLTPVNVTTRRGFLDVIDNFVADGFTCIGCGLEKALGLLNTSTETPEGAIIVVMSDGEENMKPNITTMFPKVLEGKATISTVALGPKADPKLEDLAIATRGKAFSFQDEQGNLAIDLQEAFIAATTPQADVGAWTVHLLSNTSTEVDVSVQVKSQMRTRIDDPIRVACKLGKLLVGRPDEAVVYAKVSKGKKVVLDAAVYAEVIGPNPPSKTIVQLYDDGQAPDNHANDGTYSGYFTKFTGKGRYAVTAHVTNQKWTRFVDPTPGHGSCFSEAMSAPTAGTRPGAASEYPLDDFILKNASVDSSSQTPKGFLEPVEPFQRTGSGGAFQVTTKIVELQVPPSDIRDLTVVNVRTGANDTLLVQLTWTWPGAHLTTGNASSIEIRASKDYGILKSSFENQTKLTEATVVKGDLKPLPAGSKHVSTLSLPRTLATARTDGGWNWNVYLAARVANSDGLSSDTSNIAHACYTPAPVTTTQAATTKMTTTTSPLTSSASTTRQTASTSAPVPTSTELVKPVTARKRSPLAIFPVWLWIVIGGVGGVLLISIAAVVIVKMIPQKRSTENVIVYRAPRTGNARS